MDRELADFIASTVAFFSWISGFGLMVGGAAYGAYTSYQTSGDPTLGFLLGTFIGIGLAIMICGPMLLFVDLWRFFRNGADRG